VAHWGGRGLTIDANLPLAGLKFAAKDPPEPQLTSNQQFTDGTLLGPSEGMTELQRYRLSLALAFIGALLIAAHSWSSLELGPFSRTNLPTFERSAPGLKDWPTHQYLPIG
jgi:hypothetical protein